MVQMLLLPPAVVRLVGRDVSKEDGALLEIACPLLIDDLQTRSLDGVLHPVRTFRLGRMADFEQR